MTLSRGTIEIVRLANDKKPKSFRDFTNIVIGKRKLSSATISKRLKELVALNFLSEVVIRSESGRRIIGYQTTERGMSFLEIAEKMPEHIENSAD